MSARRRYLERAARLELAADVAEIERRAGVLCGFGLCRRRYFYCASEMIYELAYAADGINIYSLDDGAFGGVVRRDKKAREAFFLGFDGHGKNAGKGFYLAA